MSATLPAGLHPEPTPAKAGPSPAPGVAVSAPGVCAFCAEHHPRFFGGGRWEHFRVTLEGSKAIGPCASPPAFEPKPPSLARPRTEAECRERLHEIASHSSTARVLGEARETYATHSQPREIGEDDGYEA